MAEKTAFELVTPARIMLATDADMIVAPGSEGLFGVLPRHAAMISTLKRGIVEIHEGGAIKNRIMVDGGIADVTPKGCTILAERAEKLDGNKANIQSRLSNASGDEKDFLTAVLDAMGG